jgi:CheY-like chemotaxis protein
MGLIPPEFLDQVKVALEHLYDPVALRDHALGPELLRGWSSPGLDRARALRQELLDAVEQLRPARPTPTDVHQSRAYQILQLRYVEGLPFREVMANLGLSQTHYHREQRHALEALATLLWDRRSLPSPAVDRADGPSENETRRADFLVATRAPDDRQDLSVVVRGVVAIVGSMALRKGVTVREDLPAQPSVIYGQRVVLRQLLISAIGYALQAAHGGELVLSCAETASEITLGVSYAGPVATEHLQDADVREHLVVCRGLAESLGGSISVGTNGNALQVSIVLAARRRTLLVIEDNPDMVQLITRFVQGHGYAVLSTATVRDGLGMAQASHPDAILLDIMLSEQDGWDALQSLKHHPDTARIPVFVCTVLAEADLAMALGAATFLRKPLTQGDLLVSLDRWLGRPPPAEENPGAPAPTVRAHSTGGAAR